MAKTKNSVLPFKLAKGYLAVDLSFLMLKQSAGGIYLPETELARKRKEAEQKLNEPVQVIEANTTEDCSTIINAGDYVLSDGGAKMFPYGEKMYGIIAQHDIVVVFDKLIHETELERIRMAKEAEKGTTPKKTIVN